MDDNFLRLSSALTGVSEIDLLATGLRAAYWKTLQEQASPAIATALLSAGIAALDTPDPMESLRLKVLNDQRLGPVARSLILLWYLGSWQPLPPWWIATYGVAKSAATAFVLSPQSYQEGLVWPVIGTHPPGAKAPGFGSWSLPPQRPGDLDA